MPRKAPIVVGIASDTHANSTIGLCPPEGVQLDDGGIYQPSPPQAWLWDCWDQFWKKVQERRRALRGDLYCVYNGDAVDGDHHQTSQIISRNLEVQAYVAERVFSAPKALRPERAFMVRGTEAHVGPSASAEENLARHLGCERDPLTRNWTWWELDLIAHDRLLNFQHHCSVSGLPWTAPGGIARLAFRIWVERMAAGERVPDLAVRSHIHHYLDSFGAHPTRAIVTPAFQLKTAHAHKVVPESAADIGGLIVTAWPDRPLDVEAVRFRPRRPAPWRAA